MIPPSCRGRELGQQQPGILHAESQGRHASEGVLVVGNLARFRDEAHSVEEFEFHDRRFISAEVEDVEAESEHVIRPCPEGQHLDSHPRCARDLGEERILLTHDGPVADRTPQDGLIQDYGQARGILPGQDLLAHRPQARLGPNLVERKIGLRLNELHRVPLRLEQAGHQVRLVRAESAGLIFQDQLRFKGFVDQVAVRTPPAPVPRPASLVEKPVPLPASHSVEIEQGINVSDTDGGKAQLHPGDPCRRPIENRRGVLLGPPRLAAQAAKRHADVPSSRLPVPVAYRHHLAPQMSTPGPASSGQNTPLAVSMQFAVSEDLQAGQRLGSRVTPRLPRTDYTGHLMTEMQPGVRCAPILYMQFAVCKPFAMIEIMTAGGRSPLMRRRRLAAAFHRLRMESRRTLEEVAAHLECSPAKVSRIETGQVAIRIQDARDLLDLYQVAEEQRAALLEMVRQARGKGWWSGYADLLDEGTQTLLSLEDEASAILIYETNLVPALLQTTQYAWELLATRSDSRLDLVQRRADLRMARQRILGRPAAPLLTVVLDEASLRRPVGSREVMREQCEYLMTADERLPVSVRVLPFSAGAHQAMGFSFQIFEFAGDEPHLVYVELLNGGQILEAAEEVGRYRAAFNQVHKRALPPDETGQFLGELAKEFG